MKKATLATALAACACLIWACSAGSGGQEPQPIGAGTLAPDYKFKDAKTGKPANLYRYKGKYKAIVLDFFASWCGPCQVAIPHVIATYNKYKGKGVLVVGINVWDKWEDMKKNIAEKKIPYPVLHDAKQKGGVSDLYKVQGIPTLFILNGKTMKVAGTWVGFDPKSTTSRDEQEAILKKLTAK